MGKGRWAEEGREGTVGRATGHGGCKQFSRREKRGGTVPLERERERE